MSAARKGIAYSAGTRPKRHSEYSAFLVPRRAPGLPLVQHAMVARCGNLKLPGSASELHPCVTLAHALLRAGVRTEPASTCKCMCTVLSARVRICEHVHAFGVRMFDVHVCRCSLRSSAREVGQANSSRWWSRHHRWFLRSQYRREGPPYKESNARTPRVAAVSDNRPDDGCELQQNTQACWGNRHW